MSDKFIKKVLNQVTKFDKAINTYTKIGKIPAIPYRAFVNMADFMFLTGCIEQSEELLNNAINFVSQSSDALVNLGFIKQTNKEYDKAIEYYKKALKKDRKNIKALCMWGNCLYAQNNIDNAIKKFEKAIELDNKSGEAYLCLGIALLKKKKYHEAKENFELATQYNPKDARGLFMLASVEIELGLYDNALEKLMFIVESTENNFGAYHNIAYIYFKKKDYNKTVIFAMTAIRLAPFKLETYLLLGDTYLMLNMEKAALEVYKSAEQQNLKSLFLYLSWGTAYQNMKQYENAIERFKQAIETEPDSINDELYARMAECSLKLDNIDDAKNYAEKALDISKENYMANEVLADILYSEHKYNESLEKYSICLKNTKKKSEIYLKIAECYEKLENFVLSNKNYEKSIEYNREHKQTLIKYIESLIKQNDFITANKKLLTLEKASNDELDILKLIYKVNINLPNNEYSRIKAQKTAEKIKKKYPDFVFEL